MSPNRRERIRALAALGRDALRRFSTLHEVATLLGEVILAFARLLRGKARYDAADTWAVVQASGAGALGVVTLVSLLIGAILAFVGAVQLLKFGAGQFVADLVSISTVREMAAVITAVVLSGRTGAAFAARIATMQGNEEIDALKTLGVSPVEFLVLPRVLALTLMMPLLYAYSCAVGLIGGWAVSVGMLDLSSTLYWTRSADALEGTHFLLGGSKSVCFGFLVAFAGCFHGLRAGRNAAAVGEATTSAVVSGIVGVIVIDAVFALCAYALDV
ncbi:MAG: ABC transporter permease [Stagnimonas sp.]|nr:ABC transporter permease [Stagnimonas sp.]